MRFNEHICIADVDVVMFSVCGIYGTSACAMRGIPHTVCGIFHVSSSSLKGLFKFLLTWVQGLRLEAVTTLKIVKQGKQCLAFWAENRFDMI